MAQHDYNIGDQNGFDFLVDLNNALSAIVTNNAGSFEPNPTFAHMLWFDKNNDLMKVRNEANSAWVIVAKKDGSVWTPYHLVNPTLSGMTTTTRLRTTAGNNTTPTGTDHPYQIGLDAELNVRFDDNAIGAFDNGVGSRLTLNRYGGGVAIGSSGATLEPTGSAPMYACRAWVNFDGTGTVRIRASGNVSSITDNGTGDYFVNFTTDMEVANYATTASWTKGSSDRNFQDGPAIPVGYGRGFVRILLTDGAANAQNGSIVSVAVFR